MQLCTKCGNPVKEGEEYCSHCGSTAAVTEAKVEYNWPSMRYFFSGFVVMLVVAVLVALLRRYTSTP